MSVSPIAYLAKSAAAHESWARTEDRSARTAPARRALDERFLREAGGDPVRAANVRAAYYRRLALASATARRARAADRVSGRDLAAESAKRAAEARRQLAEARGGAPA